MWDRFLGHNIVQPLALQVWVDIPLSSLWGSLQLLVQTFLVPFCKCRVVMLRVIQMLMFLKLFAEFRCVWSIFQAPISSSLPQWAGVRRIWVSVVVTEVLGHVVSGQFCHDVRDVAKRPKMLKALVGSTLDALGAHDVGGLVSWVLDAGPSDAQLLHDAVEETLDVGLGHLVDRAGAAGWSSAGTQAEQEAQEREPHRRCHL